MLDWDGPEAGQDGTALPIGSSPGYKQRRSLLRRTMTGLGWLASGPADWGGVRSISRGAFLVGELARTLRVQTTYHRQLRAMDDPKFDLQATASLHGISVPELQRRLDARRRQTAWIAYACVGIGALFVLAWFHAALTASWTASRILLAFDFLPFGALFFLIGFYNALLNYQIRVGRRASWREYLMTSQPFLPR